MTDEVLEEGHKAPDNTPQGKPQATIELEPGEPQATADLQVEDLQMTTEPAPGEPKVS